MAEIEITNNESGIQLDYDAISPITGNECVIIEADENTNIRLKWTFGKYNDQIFSFKKGISNFWFS